MAHKYDLRDRCAPVHAFETPTILVINNYVESGRVHPDDFPLYARYNIETQTLFDVNESVILRYFPSIEAFVENTQRFVATHSPK